jgi:hypothetical protein
MPGIVIASKKLVYWPVPKNACTTLKKYFATLEGLTYSDNESVHGAAFRYTEHVLPDYLNFAYCRNPYNRLVSLYKQKILPKPINDSLHINGVQRIVFARHMDMFRGGMSFPEFVDSICRITDPDPHFDLQTSQIPPGIVVYKVETDLFLRTLEVHNPSRQVDVPFDGHTHSRIVKHYLPDYIRFGYL